MTRTRRLGILLFDEVDPMDFVGPLEVFNIANQDRHPVPFEILLLAEHETLRTWGGIKIVPHYQLHSSPALDVLLLPGGPGVRRAIHQEPLMSWVCDQAQQVEFLLSVCTGAFFLAHGGLAQGLSLSTHHLAFDELHALAPNQPLEKAKRVVDHGKIMSSAGISSGLDLALHLVAKLLGKEVADQSAAHLEYSWHPSH